jgi:nitroreductase
MVQVRGVSDPDDWSVVDRVIRERRTVKVFRDPLDPVDPGSFGQGFRSAVNGAIESAGWAPFHHAAHLSHRVGPHVALVPWRFHILDAENCRMLATEIHSRSPYEPWTAGAASKIPLMLSACGALVLATWLPDPESSSLAEEASAMDSDEPTVRNQEHLAAAAAAVQTFLLAATSRGLASYWSSGGVLRSPEAFELCGIPLGQRLLGAVFLFDEPGEDDDFVTGKLRDLRGDSGGWCRRVELQRKP